MNEGLGELRVSQTLFYYDSLTNKEDKSSAPVKAVAFSFGKQGGLYVNLRSQSYQKSI